MRAFDSGGLKVANDWRLRSIELPEDTEKKKRFL
jgi:hypothetical protein